MATSAIGPNMTTGLLKPAERKTFGEKISLVRLGFYKKRSGTGKIIDYYAMLGIS